MGAHPYEILKQVADKVAAEQQPPTEGQ